MVLALATRVLCPLLVLGDTPFRADALFCDTGNLVPRFRSSASGAHPEKILWGVGFGGFALNFVLFSYSLGF